MLLKFLLSAIGMNMNWLCYRDIVLRVKDSMLWSLVMQESHWLVFLQLARYFRQHCHLPCIFDFCFFIVTDSDYHIYLHLWTMSYYFFYSCLQTVSSTVSCDTVSLTLLSVSHTSHINTDGNDVQCPSGQTVLL